MAYVPVKTIMIIGRGYRLAKSTYDRAANQQILHMSYGQSVAGHRVNCMVILDAPESERDERWLEEAKLKLVPTGVLIDMTTDCPKVVK